jgi:hypothetical protein
MKKLLKISFALLFVPVILVSFFTTSLAEEAAANLEVTELVVAKNVVDLAPVDTAASFTSDVGMLYCFSKVKVQEESATIFHSWYYKNEKVAQIELNVKKSDGFRTYSSKTILSDQKGEWKVEVFDAAGNVLKSVTFTVT